MKHVLLAGFCVMLLAACGCQSNEDPESSSLFSDDDLAEDAYATHVARHRATTGGTRDPTDEIYPTYWADGIKALNPIKVAANAMGKNPQHNVKTTPAGLYIGKTGIPSPRSFVSHPALPAICTQLSTYR